MSNTPLSRDFDFLRSKLLNREEVAFLDVREEAPHAEGHPLFAANFPLARIELDAFTKLPRRDVPIVTFDGGEGLAEAAARKFAALGFEDVGVFDGGLEAWKAAGGELFIDVNVPSKAFGELMEEVCHTPSHSAQEVKAMIDAGEDMVIVDSRRFDEFQVMSIPGAISVPGAELVLRVPDLAPNPETKVIVNCAGRTRSLVGTQSLINAALPNQVAALRNGTIGWLLAEQELDRGQQRRYRETPGPSREAAARRAKAVAQKAGVKHCGLAELESFGKQQGRSSYFFDVRSRAEYEAGHLPGFFPMEGGQLVQETEMYAPVRGARIVLCDDDGARANMTASWLAQMAWEVYVVENPPAEAFSETGPWLPKQPDAPRTPGITADALKMALEAGEDLTVVDFAKHAVFKQGHIPGAWYALRSQIAEAAKALPRSARYVVTCPDGRLSAFAAPELAQEVSGEVLLLEGGNQAWIDAGGALEGGEERLASAPIDRYRRPYEGTDAPRAAMQAYLDWEFGLIEQLARDGTHHFMPRPLVG
ncbi:rhodanese homology domain-containing protein [Limibacillus halophilus]